jgi:dipeptidyl aminopeptidase/acylaminoacyl peptidase
MRLRTLPAMLLVAAIAGVAEAQAPNTDIFLAPLMRSDTSLVVGPAVNVTHRVGYDNQPSFLPDGSAILYTATDSSGQADIWRYDIASRRTSRVTATPESEYSATVMPGGRRFSVIRVERDSTQRLWSFALDGSDPQLVLAALKPVGYYAWLDSTRLVSYVLGTPSTLHFVSRDGAVDEIRARDIGRAVHRVPTVDAYSFTQRSSANALLIVTQPSAGGPREVVTLAVPDNEFHEWTPNGELLTASHGILLRWNRSEFSPWAPVADLSTNGVKNVSRLAVSPDGRWLAFVAEPISP